MSAIDQTEYVMDENGELIAIENQVSDATTKITEHRNGVIETRTKTFFADGHVRLEVTLTPTWLTYPPKKWIVSGAADEVDAMVNYDVKGWVGCWCFTSGANKSTRNQKPAEIDPAKNYHPFILYCSESTAALAATTYNGCQTRPANMP